MKCLLGRLLVLLLLLLSVSYPAWASDPCRECEKARKAAALKREAKTYRRPCPKCPADTVTVVRTEKESRTKWVILALGAGAAGYLIGRLHDGGKTTEIVYRDPPKKPKNPKYPHK